MGGLDADTAVGRCARAHLPTYPALKGPRYARPKALAKYSELVTELIDELTNGDEYWLDVPGDTEKQPLFTVGMAAPSNDRFLVLLSVWSDDLAEDAQVVALAQRVMDKVGEKFPELTEWMDWQFVPG